MSFGGSTFIRLAAALNYLNAENEYPADLAPDQIDSAAYCLSNIDAAGNLTALYTDISADKPLDAQAVIDFYKVSPIGKAGNTETHFFQISAEADPAVGTVEWLCMDNAAYNVFIPYYPMLTESVFDAYTEGHDFADYVDEEPTEGTYFAAGDGWVVYPEGWENSFYWVYAALSHIALEDEQAAAQITETMAALQAEINADWAALQTAVAQAGDDAAAVATEGSCAMAEKAFLAATALLADCGL